MNSRRCVQLVRVAIQLVVCAFGAACATARTAAPSEAARCPGNYAIVIQNDTGLRIEVLLSSGGTTRGDVVDVLEPGQQSRRITVTGAGPYVYTRDQATGRLIDSRTEPRLRRAHVCE